MSNEISVNDKVILITGACGLIGKEVGLSFLKQGGKVVFSDISREALKDLERILCESYSEDQFLIVELDITKSDDIERTILASVDKFGRIDVLINNAAIDAKFDDNKQDTYSLRFENYPLELVKKSMEVNMIGTIQITQLVCRQMLKQSAGNIINLASTYSLVSPNQELYNFGTDNRGFKPIDYVATKSFIPNFSRYIATLYANDNIRCNTIVPHGIFNGHDENFINNFSRYSPMSRMCDKSELTGPFTFLASDASSYMTGSTLVVDGGWTAW